MSKELDFLNHVDLNHVKRRDRGMRKWVAFASMPEQYYGLSEVFGNLTKVEKPLLSAQQCEDVNQRISEALHKRSKVSITYYKDGHIITDQGVIDFVDVDGSRLFYTDDVFSLKNELPLNALIDIQV